VRRFRAGAVLVALLALAAGCSRPAAPPLPATPETTAPIEPSAVDDLGGTLRIGLAADPVSLDPRFVADEEGELVVGALFEPLVRLNASGRPIPGAATSWEVSEDGTTFTFDLREGRFHDGTAVTADDFVRTFERIADGTALPRSFLAYLLEPVVGSAEAAEAGGGLAGVEAIDASTLRIELSAPQPRYLRTLADPSLVPTPVGSRSSRSATARLHWPGPPTLVASSGSRPSTITTVHRSSTRSSCRSTPTIRRVIGSGRTCRTGCCRSPTSVRATSPMRRPPTGSPRTG
jgi:ABC-type transport system substrate-binding protein